MHFEISPTGRRDDELGRLVQLGATILDVDTAVRGQSMLADPDGNEFCLAEMGSR